MMVTSITTVFSFIATGFSTIMPISTFGIFAAILVTINYFEVILILPIYYLIYDKHIQPRFKCLCFRRKSIKAQNSK
jgi:predicted RND superfamily exporter protein